MMLNVWVHLEASGWVFYGTHATAEAAASTVARLWDGGMLAKTSRRKPVSASPIAWPNA